MVTPGLYLFKDEVLVCPEGVNRWRVFKDGAMHRTFTRDFSTSPYFLLLVFFCLSEGCSAMHNKLLLATGRLWSVYYSDAGSPQTSMCAAVAHVAFSPFISCKSSLRQIFEVVFCYAVLLAVKMDLKNHSFGQREGLTLWI